MHQIKSLAPTIFDAIQAIEQGCRKAQNDPHFKPAMSAWMTVNRQVCLGCLATSTLMQLTNKSAIDFIELFSKEQFPNIISREERSQCYGFEIDYGSYSELVNFEFAIEFMRNGNLNPLLEFYGLHQHKNAKEAADWFRNEGMRLFVSLTTKETLEKYADFLKTSFIPKLETWFK